jgi:hypothetical protein
MRDLEAMREIPWTETGQGWASWSFTPIGSSRLVEDGVSEKTGNEGETQDETAIRSAEMTWLWE